MWAFVIRRLAVGLLTLFLITFLVYGLIRAMPGDPIALNDEGDPKRQILLEDRKALERMYGLDKPWYIAYWTWAGNVLQGELGDSITADKRPVKTVIGERIGPTLVLSASSLILAYLISVPLGLLSVARSGKWDERVGSLFLYVLYSFPSFVAALMLQIFVAVKLGWFPLQYMRSDGYEKLSAWGQIVDLAWHATLPVIVFTYGSLAYYSRFIRSNMEEVVRQDYIRTARAKGLGEFAVIVKHAFRNTLIPFVTKIGLSLPELLGGSVIIERIFSWPGLGQLYLSAISGRNYPVIMAQTLIFAVLTLAGQFLADVLYALVDPRVRIEDSGE
ncbi:MAG: ABC transporter permease [Planctomycetota bacterium]|nr:MAG: ABC transporter permease [Planctomycetota bacterium]